MPIMEAFDALVQIAYERTGGDIAGAVAMRLSTAACEEPVLLEPISASRCQSQIAVSLKEKFEPRKCLRLME